jgi:hypothetical protein
MLACSIHLHFLDEFSYTGLGSTMFRIQPSFFFENVFSLVLSTCHRQRIGPTKNAAQTLGPIGLIHSYSRVKTDLWRAGNILFIHISRGECSMLASFTFLLGQLASVVTVRCTINVMVQNLENKI